MLSLEEKNKIDDLALQERRKYCLGEEASLGTKIFTIIENVYKSSIMLYPLKTKKVAGFTRKQDDTIQVFVNTNFSLAYQVFVAAHEIYHLINLRNDQKNSFIMCNEEDIIEGVAENTNNHEEINANYFAAAFLLPKSILLKRFQKVRLSESNALDLIMEIIKLQYEYEIPYKTILKRMNEVEILSSNQLSYLEKYESDIVKFYDMYDDELKKNLVELDNITSRKYHSFNVPKLAYDVYKNNYITINKLEHIINKYDKTLGDFGIQKNEDIALDFNLSDFKIGDESDEKN